MRLGWNATLWDENGLPEIFVRMWEDLTDAQREDAGTLGYGKAEWEAEYTSSSDEEACSICAPAAPVLSHLWCSLCRTPLLSYNCLVPLSLGSMPVRRDRTQLRNWILRRRRRASNLQKSTRQHDQKKAGLCENRRRAKI